VVKKRQRKRGSGEFVVLIWENRERETLQRERVGGREWTEIRGEKKVKLLKEQRS